MCQLAQNNCLQMCNMNININPHSQQSLYKFWWIGAHVASNQSHCDSDIKDDDLLGDLMVRLSCGHFSDFLPMASVQMFNKFSHPDANLDSPEDCLKDNEEQWQMALDQEEYIEFQGHQEKIQSILLDVHHPVCVITSKCEQPADSVDNFIAKVEDTIGKTDLLNNCIHRQLLMVVLVVKSRLGGN